MVKGKESSTSGTLAYTMMGDKGTGHARPRPMVGRQGPSGSSRDPHPAGRQDPTGQGHPGRDPHPLGHQPGHQGEWALVKETSCTQGKQPVH